MRNAIDESREPELIGLVWPEEQPGVVVADSLDSRDILSTAIGDVHQVHIVQPSVFGELKGAVLLFPAGILGRLPSTTDNGSRAIGGPSGKLCP